MEQEPKIVLSIGEGRELEGTRDTASLFRFVGELALYDHIFFITDPEENIGAYLFGMHPVFEEVADFMMLHDFPAHLNLREVAECDLDAFAEMISDSAASDLDAGVPEDWV